MKQKTLNLVHKQEATFSTFNIPDSQPNLLEPVYSFLATKEFAQTFYLWGQPGSGKSHILQSTINYMTKTGHQAFYTCLKLPKITPAIFEQLEHFDIICLDNIDYVLNEQKWQEAIFYCLDLAETRNIKIMVSSSKNLNELTATRAETHSKLAASYRLKLPTLNESELQQALKKRARYRQIPIKDNIFQYMMNYAPRDGKSMFKLLDQISELSLVNKKSISKKMIREILQANKLEHINH